MYASLALAAALWPATITEHCPPFRDSIVIGVALNSRREFLYCEYFSQMSEQQVSVNYIRNSTSFASKELDYSINPLIPGVKQIDRRTGEQREAQVEQNKLQLSYKTGTDKQTETATLSLEDVTVVDAGFDNFVKANWDKLIAGKSLAISFGSIAHLKSLPLRIKSTNCSQQKKGSPSQYCFSVDIDNSLLRLLLSSIKINYDENKRLVQFSGVVNLQDDLQKLQSATINYFYKQDYLTAEKQVIKKPQ